MADKLTEQLHLTVANARVKWMFGNQARSVLVSAADGATYVAPSFRAPEKWYIFCMSVYLNNSTPGRLMIDQRPEIPYVEVPNSDDWWDTNTGKAVNKKDIKFEASRGNTDRSVTHLALYDNYKIANNRSIDGKLWDLVRLTEPFTLGPTQTAVIRAGSLMVFGFNMYALTQF